MDRGSYRKLSCDMECIPESPTSSPVFTPSSPDDRSARRTRFFPDTYDLSDDLLTASIESLEAKVIKICNKKCKTTCTSCTCEDSYSEISLPDRFKEVNTNRNKLKSVSTLKKKMDEKKPLFTSTLTLEIQPVRNTHSVSMMPPADLGNKVIPTKFSYLGTRTKTSVESCDYYSSVKETPLKGGWQQEKKEKMSEEDLKKALEWARNELMELRRDDRKLLKQFIEIKFQIEALSCQRSNWTRTTSLSSFRDLSSLGTLPHPPKEGTPEPKTEFRQRALSLRTPKLVNHPSVFTLYSFKES